MVQKDITATADTAAEVKKWRDLQQKIGKVELTDEEAQLLPELARAANQLGALGPLGQQLLEERQRFEQSLAISKQSVKPPRRSILSSVVLMAATPTRCSLGIFD